MHCTIPLVCRFWGLSLICVYLWKLKHRPKGDIQSSPLRGGVGDIIGRGIRASNVSHTATDPLILLRP